MSFRALLVTEDDQARNALTPVLSNFGLSVHFSTYADALSLVTEQKFQAVLADFDDPHSAALIFERLVTTPFQSHAVRMALLWDRSKVRNAFGRGAHFVLFKPIRETQADSTLRAAVCLIRTERRNSLRIPVQVPVKLAWNTDEDAIDGIMLDLSEDGMDVLAAQPLYCSAMISARFRLPDLPPGLEIPGEVVWANPNGESGIRFSEISDQAREVLCEWLSQHSMPAPLAELTPRPDCKLTDLSLGGCYMETPSPFPERTWVRIRIGGGGRQFEAPGLVRVMHPSHGMGIEFTHAPEGPRELAAFIASLPAPATEPPELSVSPCATPSDDPKPITSPIDIDDPLLELLRRHESFSQETFLESLHRQRGGQTAPA
jgi:CheY-like chemotaxis protein